MKIASTVSRAITVLCFTASAFVPTPALAQSTSSDWDSGKWAFAATIYGFVPTIDGKVNYAGDSRSSDLHVSMSDVLNHLKMTFQGSFDVHNDRWGLFNDVIYVYLDVGTGQTQLTWQGATGIGYAYPRGEVVAMYRYLDWNAKSGDPIADLNMGRADDRGDVPLVSVHA